MAKTNPMDDLREVLLATGVVLPLRVSSRGNVHSVLCRPVRGQDHVWLAAVEEILKAFEARGEDSPEIDLHLGRQYVLKNGKMAAGWYVGITCTKANLGEAIGIIREKLAGVEPEDEPLEEAYEEGSPQPRQRFQSAYPEMDPRLHAQVAGAPHHVRELRGRTTAPPREMEHVPDPVVPKRDVRLKVIERRTEVRDDGRVVPIEVKEIPLPHVYGDLNRENVKGKGAIGGAGSMPLILRNRS